MAEGPKLWDRMYDTIYDPIAKWPIRSLGFFSLWLGGGIWATNGPGFPAQPEPLYVTLLTLALVVPGVGALLCLHRVLVVRDPPPSLSDIGALERIKQSFVGRDEDAENLINLILSSQQVWLNGDSGVGKSVLLRKAILPALKNRQIGTIYVNAWRGDWEQGPALALLKELGIESREECLNALEDSLNSFRGVVILDQFDEFQIEHASKLISPTAQVISRGQLESRNGFFRILNAAVRDHRVRCVYVTRRDVEWGKRPVLFDEAEEFFLGRLGRNVVEAEVSRIIPPEIVQSPENGWFELRAEFCSDLAGDGILPVQMRFAILGLEKLRDGLTRTAYHRIGGLDGLVSSYLEDEVRRVSGNKLLSSTIFSLLDRLVTPEGSSTTPIAEPQLLEQIPLERLARVKEALEGLQRADFVRRVMSPDGALLWRLDHDYLAAPVRAIVRRQLPEQWEVQEEFRRFVAAPWWDKPRRLAGPIPLARYLRARLLRGLRFGPAAPWVLFSVSAYLLFAAAGTYIAWNRIEEAANEQQASDLFSDFSPTKGLSDAEAEALQRLARTSLSSRQHFLQLGFQSPSNSDRLTAHIDGMKIALGQVDSKDILRLFYGSISPALARSGTRMSVSTPFIRDWAIPSLLPVSDADMLAEKVVSWITGDDFGSSDTDKLLPELDGLGQKVSTRQAGVLAGRLLAQIAAKPQAYKLRNLASALHSFESKIPATTIDAAAARIVEPITRSDETDVGLRASALGALGNKVSADNIDVAATRLVNLMGGAHVGIGFPAMASGLRALGSRVNADNINAAAATLVRLMADEKYPKSLLNLASTLGALGNKVSADNIDIAATRLVNLMGVPGADYDHLEVLASALGKLGDKVGADRIDTAASILVGRMDVDDADTLEAMASGLGALGSRVAARKIDDAATKLVSELAFENSGEVLNILASGVGALGGQVSTDTADALSKKLLDIIVSDTDQNLVRRAPAMSALGIKVSAKVADSLSGKLVDLMVAKTDSRSFWAYGAILAELRNATLSSPQLARIPRVFNLSSAPCAVALQLDRASRQSVLVHQLHNPLCTEQSWKQMALDLAQLSGQSFATGDQLKPSEIRVDFPKLCDYVASQQSWYDAIKPSRPQAAGLTLLLASVVTFIWGLTRFPARTPPASIARTRP
jgi:hypothetical protein